MSDGDLVYSHKSSDNGALVCIAWGHVDAGCLAFHREHKYPRYTIVITPNGVYTESIKFDEYPYRIYDEADYGGHEVTVQTSKITVKDWVKDGMFGEFHMVGADGSQAGVTDVNVSLTYDPVNMVATANFSSNPTSTYYNACDGVTFSGAYSTQTLDNGLVVLRTATLYCKDGNGDTMMTMSIIANSYDGHNPLCTHR